MKSSLRALSLTAALVFSLFATGCVTPPPTYRTHEKFAGKTTADFKIAVLPLDAELHELQVGGKTEKRDEWIALANQHINAALQNQTSFKIETTLATPLTPEAQLELEEVQSLFRSITLNHIYFQGFNPPADLKPGALKPITYQVGELKYLPERFQADAVLILFTRDYYSSGGRKALGALTMIAAAAVGVGVVPQSAPTLSSACLISQDGTVLWLNFSGSTGDLREAEGGEAYVRTLLAGLPRK